MRRLVAVTLIVVLAASLTGCGKSIEDRIKDRDMCEAAGGTYEEWTGGDSVRRGVCDLSTTNERNETK